MPNATTARTLKSNSMRVRKFLQVIRNVPSSLIGLEHAYAAALSVDELFAVLRQSITESRARYVILNAIDSCSPSDKLTVAASEFAAALLNASRENFREAQSHNLILDRLFPHVGVQTQASIISCWLSCRFADSKKRFVKWAQRKAGFGGDDEIFLYWQNTSDTAAVKHLIYDSDISWLKRNSDKLLKSTLKPWLLSKLLLRMSEHQPEIIELARARDPITYLYLCAKTGKSISAPDAVALFDGSARDVQRRGLALWAIGKLGLWNALNSISSNAEKLAKQDEDAFFASLAPGRSEL